MDWTSIAGIIVAIIPAVAGWAGARLAARSQERAAILEHRGPDWQAFVQEIKDQNAQTKEWARGELEKRDEEISQLRSEVNTLRDKVEQLKSKYFSAVQHIRDWRSTHPETIENLPLPDAIRFDI